MIPPWWGIPVVIVVGAVVVWWGWRHDRDRALRARSGARPTREIPALAADMALPAVADPPPDLPPAIDPSLDATAARRDEAPSLPAGAASGAFLNHADRGLAVLREPSVLVLDDDLTAERALLEILGRAKRRGAPLVLVAPYITEALLGTVRANVLHGGLRVLPVLLDDPAQRRRAVAQTGGRMVSASHLAAGLIPDAAWGSCAAWVADLDDSWVIPSDDDPAER